MVKCRKCGSSERLQEHHLFPKAHAIMNNINPDLKGRVMLCFRCHKLLHLMLGNTDKIIGLLWIDKSEGKKDDSTTTVEERISVLFNTTKE